MKDWIYGILNWAIAEADWWLDVLGMSVIPALLGVAYMLIAFLIAMAVILVWAACLGF